MRGVCVCVFVCLSLNGTRPRLRIGCQSPHFSRAAEGPAHRGHLTSPRPVGTLEWKDPPGAFRGAVAPSSRTAVGGALKLPGGGDEKSHRQGGAGEGGAAGVSQSARAPSPLAGRWAGPGDVR